MRGTLGHCFAQQWASGSARGRELPAEVSLPCRERRVPDVRQTLSARRDEDIVEGSQEHREVVNLSSLWQEQEEVPTKAVRGLLVG